MGVQIHKVHIYLEYHSIRPLVGIGTPPPHPPLPQVSLPSPLEPNGGYTQHTRLLVRGWGSTNSDDWREESLVLYIFVFKSIYQKSESIGELVEGISNTLLSMKKGHVCKEPKKIL